jgi:hypothetical protein
LFLGLAVASTNSAMGMLLAAVFKTDVLPTIFGPRDKTSRDVSIYFLSHILL